MAVREIVVEQRHEEHQGDDRIGRKEPLLPEPRDQPGADRPAREQHVARCEEQQQHDDDGGVLHRTISRYRSGIVGAASAPALERLCNRTPRPDNAQPSCTTRGESSNLAASDLSPPRPGHCYVVQATFPRDRRVSATTFSRGREPVAPFTNRPVITAAAACVASRSNQIVCQYCATASKTFAFVSILFRCNTTINCSSQNCSNCPHPYPVFMT